MRILKRTLTVVAMLIIAINANAWPWLSPYAYCFNNPVKFIDPDGERPKVSEAALMAAYVYKDNMQKMGQYAAQLAKRGWIVSNFPTSIQMDYTRFDQNGLQSALFQRTVDGSTEYVYVYAGTNSVEDAVEDIAQLAGVAPQYHTAINNARTLSNELGESELTFVGHSLGGGEATLPGKTIVIPTGIMPTHTIDDFLKQKLPEP